MEPTRLIFDVFGGRMIIETASDGWAAYYLGNEGRRISAYIPIPAQLDGPGIAQYLHDLFHESATAEHPTVRMV